MVISAGESVVIWPEAEGKKYKDFNDMCIDRGIDEIPVEWLLSNTFTGMTAKVKLSTVSPPC